jgi:hypothetical protein
MDLCVFDFIKKHTIFYIQMVHEAMCTYYFDFLKYDFYCFNGHVNFCLCTKYSIHTRRKPQLE